MGEKEKKVASQCHSDYDTRTNKSWLNYRTKISTKTTDATKKLRHDPDRTDRRTYSAVPWHNTAYAARNIGLPGVRGRTLQREVYPGTPPGLPVFFALRRCNTYVQHWDWWRNRREGNTKGRREGRGRVREKRGERKIK